MFNGLDLFSGIGGLSLALAPWVRPVAYCEIDRYCQGVLLSRMADGSLPNAPIWDDARTLTVGSMGDSKCVDIIYGGFPCQDISVAGHGKGLAGERSGLFFEITRLVEGLRPQFVFLENVPAIRTRGGERVVKELASLWYDCRWDCLSAQEVGAPHIRNRWWLLAADAKRDFIRHQPWWSGGEIGKNTAISRHDGATGCLADFESKRCGKGRAEPEIRRRRHDSSGSCEHLANTNEQPTIDTDTETKTERDGWSWSREDIGRGGWWETEPDVGRVVDELPYRVDRLRGLGNAVVPAQAREAFKRLMGLG